MDDRSIGKVGNFLLMNRHKHDEIPTEFGSRKSEKQEIEDTAENQFKIRDSTKLMRKESDSRKKLLKT